MAATRYEQRTHAPGLNSWVYAYANETALSRSWVGCGLEIGVQLEGQWSFRGRFTGPGSYPAGTACRASLGEPYSHSYRAQGRLGLQVGFVVFGDELERLAGGGELRFVGDAGLGDRELIDFARWYHEASRAAVVPADVVRSIVHRYVQRHCESVPANPLTQVKRELEAYFDCDLSMKHVCEVAGLHPETFARQHKATYGLTPAAYRVCLRLNHAARLCWSRLDLSVAEIAQQSGFQNRAYFHRAFLKSFGVTPAAVRARQVSALEAA